MELSKTAIASLSILLMGLLLISKPIIGIFNKIQYISGIPSLYAYLFLLWIGIIVASIFLFKIKKEANNK